jgi:5-methylcytosine-specific restriction protein A
LIKSRERRTDPVKRQRLAFYSSKAWRDCRAAYLAEHPLCVECLKQKLYVQATVVDHIVERKQGGDDFDWSNLQAMCNRHHNIKTRRDGGAW